MYYILSTPYLQINLARSHGIECPRHEFPCCEFDVRVRNEYEIFQPVVGGNPL